MHRDVIGFVTRDLILRIIPGGVMRIAFVIDVLRVHLYDPAGDLTGFGIPGNVIANFEFVFSPAGFHRVPLAGLCAFRGSSVGLR